MSQSGIGLQTYKSKWILCYYRLIGEVQEIQKSIDALVAQLQDAEASLKQLQDDRMTLEKEISIKKNTIFIDKNKCMTHRTRYPTTMKLQGYNQ